MSNTYFTADPITDYRTSGRSDPRMVDRLRRGLLSRDVFANLGTMLYLTLAHSDRVIDRALAAFAQRWPSCPQMPSLQPNRRDK